MPDLDRVSAVRLLAESREALVVVPSRFENSPYTVLETIVAGRPLLTSREVPAVSGFAETAMQA